jgi:signal transduction histidine kinase/ligand-binding sensor domain-containing protein
LRNLFNKRGVQERSFTTDGVSSSVQPAVGDRIGCRMKNCFGAPLARLVFSAVLLVLPQFCLASASERFLVRSWQSEDGLPSNSIRAVGQAADGYLWLATAEGVVRFDGIRFSRFTDEATASLAQRPARALFALQNGEVWISSARGGLLRWDGSRLGVVWEDAGANTQAPRIITQVADDGGGGAFIERGDEVYHATGPSRPRLLERTPELVEKLRVAVLTQGQRVATAPLEAPLELVDSHGWHWKKTPAGLSFSGIGEEYEPIALPEFDARSRITTLLLDREGNLWVATNGSGLFQIRSRRVNVIGTAAGLTDRGVRSLLQDRSGALWAANKSGGVDQIVDGQVTHFTVGGGDATRPVTAMCEDHNGTLWVARHSSSVSKWSDGKFRTASSPTMPIWRVAAMLVGGDGRLWLGGEQGLAVWADEALTRFGAGQGIPEQKITALALDATGQTWFGTADGALFHGRDAHFKKVGQLSDRVISSLLHDADGTVWITTLGGGLFCWKDGRARRFAEREGLPDNRLTCVLDDGIGHLWLGSLGGIFRVAKTALMEVVAEDRIGADWLRLDRSDGMLSRECTGDFHPAGWRGSDGTLYFPTVNGIAKVQPATLEVNKLPPSVIIEEARAHGRSWQAGGTQLKVGPGRSRLEFRYTALSLSAPEKVRFRTKLEGLEDEWRDVGTQRTAGYQAVPPGQYRFCVAAASGDGVWNETGASLAIHVAPHFWQTLWFQSVAAALAVAVAFGIGAAISRARLRGRFLRLEAQTSRHKERARIARDLHDDLGASLTEISLLAHLASESPTLDRDPLPEIASKARALVSALDEIVWATNPRQDTLASLAVYLGAFAAEFLQAAGISVRLEIPNHLPEVPLDTERRYALFLAVREALNNVVKHSAATEVWLRLHADHRELKIAVEDNGQGLPEGVSELSEGLRNMHARLTSIGGECSVQSGATGTRVFFSLSLDGSEAQPVDISKAVPAAV